MTATVFVAVVMGFAGLSVWARTAQIRRAYEVREGAQPTPSPLSRAIEESLATAAGIYVALSALSAFLKVNVPQLPLPWGFSVDPVPALSILLAIIQPVFGRA